MLLITILIIQNPMLYKLMASGEVEKLILLIIIPKLLLKLELFIFQSMDIMTCKT